MRHLIDPLDFTLEETTKVLDLADRIAESPEVYSHVADGKKIATLFYEPSTRTRLSFESAMLSLGGKSLGFAGAEQSSATKGETVADTARVVSCYADIIAMRHPKEGAPLRASMYATDQMINAGDGGHNHPTQTLIDFMTIRQRKGHLDHLLPKLDVLYMTRVQKEHFFNEEDYVRLKDTYILNQEKLNLAQLDMPVLHPLPRVEEIAVDVDQDPRAAYFDQV
jgi:aspartate carbamoyltransferase catalytic subunit